MSVKEIANRITWKLSITVAGNIRYAKFKKQIKKKPTQFLIEPIVNKRPSSMVKVVRL